jgi:hypothetical protein
MVNLTSGKAVFLVILVKHCKLFRFGQDKNRMKKTANDVLSY